MLLLDTFAWVEFFNGTPQGAKVKKLLETRRVCTGLASFAELSEVCLRCGFDVPKTLEFVRENSIVLGLSMEIMENAGMVSFENKKTIKGWGMMDSLVYATALAYGLQVLTGDGHFNGLANSLMLESL